MQIIPRLTVGFDSDEFYERAQALASRIHAELNNECLPRLSVTADKLVLLTEGFSPLYVDFNNPIWQQRRDAGKKQGLVRACKPGRGLRIIDATAGWGRDAAVLASFGAQVLMLERSPVMAVLLADGLERLDSQASLTLLCTDANEYLQGLSAVEYPDVIYIDPMHPLRQKSALVKKDMQVLQHLLGADHDAEALIQIALERTRQRVVVKWPQRLDPLVKPTMSIEGKTVRFDVYIRR